jgi:hypothetical protein
MEQEQNRNFKAKLNYFLRFNGLDLSDAKPKHPPKIPSSRNEISSVVDLNDDGSSIFQDQTSSQDLESTEYFIPQMTREQYHHENDSQTTHSTLNTIPEELHEIDSQTTQSTEYTIPLMTREQYQREIDSQTTHSTLNTIPEETSTVHTSPDDVEIDVDDYLFKSNQSEISETFKPDLIQQQRIDRLYNDFIINELELLTLEYDKDRPNDPLIVLKDITSETPFTRKFPIKLTPPIDVNSKNLEFIIPIKFRAIQQRDKLTTTILEIQSGFIDQKIIFNEEYGDFFCKFIIECASVFDVLKKLTIQKMESFNLHDNFDFYIDEKNVILEYRIKDDIKIKSDIFSFIDDFALKYIKFEKITPLIRFDYEQDEDFQILYRKHLKAGDYLKKNFILTNKKNEYYCMGLVDFINLKHKETIWQHIPCNHLRFVLEKSIDWKNWSKKICRYPYREAEKVTMVIANDNKNTIFLRANTFSYVYLLSSHYFFLQKIKSLNFKIKKPFNWSTLEAFLNRIDCSVSANLENIYSLDEKALPKAKDICENFDRNTDYVVLKVLKDYVKNEFVLLLINDKKLFKKFEDNLPNLIDGYKCCLKYDTDAMILHVNKKPRHINFEIMMDFIRDSVVVEHANPSYVDYKTFNKNEDLKIMRLFLEECQTKTNKMYFFMQTGDDDCEQLLYYCFEETKQKQLAFDFTFELTELPNVRALQAIKVWNDWRELYEGRNKLTFDENTMKLEGKFFDVVFFLTITKYCISKIKYRDVFMGLDHKIKLEDKLKNIVQGCYFDQVENRIYAFDETLKSINDLLYQQAETIVQQIDPVFFKTVPIDASTLQSTIETEYEDSVFNPQQTEIAEIFKDDTAEIAENIQYFVDLEVVTLEYTQPDDLPNVILTKLSTITQSKGNFPIQLSTAPINSGTAIEYTVIIADEWYNEQERCKSSQVDVKMDNHVDQEIILDQYYGEFFTKFVIECPTVFNVLKNALIQYFEKFTDFDFYIDENKLKIHYKLYFTNDLPFFMQSVYNYINTFCDNYLLFEQLDPLVRFDEDEDENFQEYYCRNLKLLECLQNVYILKYKKNKFYIMGLIDDIRRLQYSFFINEQEKFENNNSAFLVSNGYKKFETKLHGHYLWQNGIIFDYDYVANLLNIKCPPFFYSYLISIIQFFTDKIKTIQVVKKDGLPNVCNEILEHLVNSIECSFGRTGQTISSINEKMLEQAKDIIENFNQNTDYIILDQINDETKQVTNLLVNDKMFLKKFKDYLKNTVYGYLNCTIYGSDSILVRYEKKDLKDGFKKKELYYEEIISFLNNNCNLVCSVPAYVNSNYLQTRAYLLSLYLQESQSKTSELLFMIKKVGEVEGLAYDRVFCFGFKETIHKYFALDFTYELTGLTKDRAIQTITDWDDWRQLYQSRNNNKLIFNGNNMKLQGKFFDVIFFLTITKYYISRIKYRTLILHPDNFNQEFFNDQLKSLKNICYDAKENKVYTIDSNNFDVVNCMYNILPISTPFKEWNAWNTEEEATEMVMITEPEEIEYQINDNNEPDDFVFNINQSEIAQQLKIPQKQQQEQVFSNKINISDYQLVTIDENNNVILIEIPVQNEFPDKIKESTNQDISHIQANWFDVQDRCKSTIIITENDFIDQEIIINEIYGDFFCKFVIECESVFDVLKNVLTLQMIDYRRKYFDFYINENNNLIAYFAARLADTYKIKNEILNTITSFCNHFVKFEEIKPILKFDNDQDDNFLWYYCRNLKLLSLNGFILTDEKKIYTLSLIDHLNYNKKHVCKSNYYFKLRLKVLHASKEWQSWKEKLENDSFRLTCFLDSFNNLISIKGPMFFHAYVVTIVDYLLSNLKYCKVTNECLLAVDLTTGTSQIQNNLNKILNKIECQLDMKDDSLAIFSFNEKNISKAKDTVEMFEENTNFLTYDKKNVIFVSLLMNDKKFYKNYLQALKDYIHSTLQITILNTEIILVTFNGQMGSDIQREWVNSTINNILRALVSGFPLAEKYFGITQDKLLFSNEILDFYLKECQAKTSELFFKIENTGDHDYLFIYGYNETANNYSNTHFYFTLNGLPNINALQSIRDWSRMRDSFLHLNVNFDGDTMNLHGYLFHVLYFVSVTKYYISKLQYRDVENLNQENLADVLKDLQDVYFDQFEKRIYAIDETQFEFVFKCINDLQQTASQSTINTEVDPPIVSLDSVDVGTVQSQINLISTSRTTSSESISSDVDEQGRSTIYTEVGLPLVQSQINLINTSSTISSEFISLTWDEQDHQGASQTQLPIDFPVELTKLRAYDPLAKNFEKLKNDWNINQKRDKSTIVNSNDPLFKNEIIIVNERFGDLFCKFVIEGFSVFNALKTLLIAEFRNLKDFDFYIDKNNLVISYSTLNMVTDLDSDSEGDKINVLSFISFFAQKYLKMVKIEPIVEFDLETDEDFQTIYYNNLNNLEFMEDVYILKIENEYYCIGLKENVDDKQNTFSGTYECLARYKTLKLSKDWINWQNKLKASIPTESDISMVVNYDYEQKIHAPAYFFVYLKSIGDYFASKQSYCKLTKELRDLKKDLKFKKILENIECDYVNTRIYSMNKEMLYQAKDLVDNYKTNSDFIIFDQNNDETMKYTYLLINDELFFKKFKQGLKQIVGNSFDCMIYGTKFDCVLVKHEELKKSVEKRKDVNLEVMKFLSDNVKRYYSAPTYCSQTYCKDCPEDLLNLYLKECQNKARDLFFVVENKGVNVDHDWVVCYGLRETMAKHIGDKIISHTIAGLTSIKALVSIKEWNTWRKIYSNRNKLLVYENNLVLDGELFDVCFMVALTKIYNSMIIRKKLKIDGPDEVYQQRKEILALKLKHVEDCYFDFDEKKVYTIDEEKFLYVLAIIVNVLSFPSADLTVVQVDNINISDYTIVTVEFEQEKPIVHQTKIINEEYIKREFPIKLNKKIDYSANQKLEIAQHLFQVLERTKPEIPANSDPKCVQVELVLNEEYGEFFSKFVIECPFIFDVINNALICDFDDDFNFYFENTRLIISYLIEIENADIFKEQIFKVLNEICEKYIRFEKIEPLVKFDNEQDEGFQFIYSLNLKTLRIYQDVFILKDNNNYYYCMGLVDVVNFKKNVKKSKYKSNIRTRTLEASKDWLRFQEELISNDISASFNDDFMDLQCPLLFNAYLKSVLDFFAIKMKSIEVNVGQVLSKEVKQRINLLVNQIECEFDVVDQIPQVFSVNENVLEQAKDIIERFYENMDNLETIPVISSALGTTVIGKSNDETIPGDQQNVKPKDLLNLNDFIIVEYDKKKQIVFQTKINETQITREFPIGLKTTSDKIVNRIIPKNLFTLRRRLKSVYEKNEDPNFIDVEIIVNKEYGEFFSKFVIECESAFDVFKNLLTLKYKNNFHIHVDKTDLVINYIVRKNEADGLRQEIFQLINDLCEKYIKFVKIEPIVNFEHEFDEEFQMIYSKNLKTLKDVFILKDISLQYLTLAHRGITCQYSKNEFYCMGLVDAVNQKQVPVKSEYKYNLNRCILEASKDWIMFHERLIQSNFNNILLTFENDMIIIIAPAFFNEYLKSILYFFDKKLKSIMVKVRQVLSVERKHRLNLLLDQIECEFGVFDQIPYVFSLNENMLEQAKDIVENFYENTDYIILNQMKNRAFLSKKDETINKYAYLLINDQSLFEKFKQDLKQIIDDSSDCIFFGKQSDSVLIRHEELKKPVENRKNANSEVIKFLDNIVKRYIPLPSYCNELNINTCPEDLLNLYLKECQNKARNLFFMLQNVTKLNRNWVVCYGLLETMKKNIGDDIISHTIAGLTCIKALLSIKEWDTWRQAYVNKNELVVEGNNLLLKGSIFDVCFMLAVTKYYKKDLPEDSLDPPEDSLDLPQDLLDLASERTSISTISIDLTSQSSTSTIQLTTAQSSIVTTYDQFHYVMQPDDTIFESSQSEIAKEYEHEDLQQQQQQQEIKTELSFNISDFKIVTVESEGKNQVVRQTKILNEPEITRKFPIDLKKTVAYSDGYKPLIPQNLSTALQRFKPNIRKNSKPEFNQVEIILNKVYGEFFGKFIIGCPLVFDVLKHSLLVDYPSLHFYIEKTNLIIDYTAKNDESDLVGDDLLNSIDTVCDNYIKFEKIEPIVKFDHENDKDFQIIYSNNLKTLRILKDVFILKDNKNEFYCMGLVDAVNQKQNVIKIEFNTKIRKRTLEISKVWIKFQEKLKLTDISLTFINDTSIQIKGPLFFLVYLKSIIDYCGNKMKSIDVKTKTLLSVEARQRLALLVNQIECEFGDQITPVFSLNEKMLQQAKDIIENFYENTDYLILDQIKVETRMYVYLLVNDKKFFETFKNGIKDTVDGFLKCKIYGTDSVVVMFANKDSILKRKESNYEDIINFLKANINLNNHINPRYWQSFDLFIHMEEYEKECQAKTSELLFKVKKFGKKHRKIRTTYYSVAYSGFEATINKHFSVDFSFELTGLTNVQALHAIKDWNMWRDLYQQFNTVDFDGNNMKLEGKFFDVVFFLTITKYFISRIKYRNITVHSENVYQQRKKDLKDALKNVENCYFDFENKKIYAFLNCKIAENIIYKVLNE